MPVYVTRAHVTLGDASKKDKHKSSQVKRPFHILDICNTPYCLRTFCVSLVGLFIVAAGCLMTILGYRPEILIPGLVHVNVTTSHNQSEPVSEPHVTDLSGLSILVYIGPILMGVGFFSMMMTIVLFCEIKDRYFTNILPKEKTKKMPKDHLYDEIISEFRKNYFRGIEVPLKASEERRKSKRRFSFSLSRTGSMRSSGRRNSQESARRKLRKNSRDSCNSERTASAKFKRSTIRRLLDPDSWMKTSSLPNIRHKEDFVELREIYDIDNNIEFMTPKRASRSCGPHLEIFKISKGQGNSGVDNPAYRDSPTDKKKLLLNQESLDAADGNTHVTTVLIHRESINNDDIVPAEENDLSIPPFRGELLPEESRDEAITRTPSNDSVIDIDRDITLIPCNEESKSIPNDATPATGAVCVCGTGEFCDIHTLGMDSESSSLSLSWDGVPCEWNDARRNTEPMFPVYPCLCRNVSETDGKPVVVKSSQYEHKPVIKSKSSMTSRDYQLQSKSMDYGRRGPFRTCIGVFRSESNIPKMGPYSLLRQYDDDNLSLDSLDLTEEMLKNFEIAEMAYI